MSIARRFRMRASRTPVILLAAASTGCSPPEHTDSHAYTPDSTAVDVLPEPGVVGTIGDADPGDAAPGGPEELVAPPPAPPPVRPAPTTPPITRSVRAGVLVHGRVELQLDATRRMPADYLLVRLRSDAATVEAWTTRDGEYFFRNVRPGSYELQFLTSPKDERPAFRHRLTVGTGEDVRVPMLRIPIDSIGSSGRIVGVP